MEPTPSPFAIRLFLGSLFILFLSIILFAKRGCSPQTLDETIRKEMSGKSQTLSSGQIEQVKSVFWKTLGKWFLIFIAVLCGVTGLSLYGIKKRVERKVEALILEQFQEPRIKNIMKSVAKNQAKEIIENNLNPEIAKANLSITKKTNLFNKDITQLKSNYDSQLKALKTEVDYIKQRNTLLKLGDLAIATGDAFSFDKLNDLITDKNETNDEFKTIARSEVFRIKSHFALMTRIKGVDPRWEDPKTKKYVEINDIPTEILIKGLNDSKQWQNRAKLAEYLQHRKEKGVPDALLRAIKKDLHLEVREKAMKSFERVTGFESLDVFNHGPAKVWWNKNKKNIENNLKELQTLESYYLKNKDI